MLLTISEAAKLMSVCENTLRDWDETGKFKAIRTDGGHRRYNLEQVREYLDNNQTVEEVEEKFGTSILLDKWNYILKDVESKRDKHVLATILDNAFNYYEQQDGGCIFEREEYLWLTKEAWLRAKLRSLVSVQPLSRPCDLIHYFKDGKVYNEPIATKTLSYNFKIFGSAKFETVKELYADTIGAEIDSMILDLLPRVNYEATHDAANATIDRVDFSEIYDYIVGPEALIKKLEKQANGVQLFKIPVMLDKETFLPVVAAGSLPTKTSLPVFSPYILVIVAPYTFTGVRSCLGRIAIFTGEGK